MQITMKRDNLISQLEAKLAEAKLEDAKAAEKHRKAEDAAMEKFRTKLKEAMKWDWKKAKAARYNDIAVEVPACPRLEHKPIEAVLKMVRASESKQFVVKSDTDIHRALFWIPASKQRNTVCD